MSNSQAVATINPPRQSLLATMAGKYGVDPDKMLTTLKATAFQGKVSNEQMMALLVVANQYNLNPWLKEIYAFPDRNNGIVPVVGIDGWARIINEHPQFDGMEFEQDDKSCTCIIYRKDRARPIRVTEYLAECRRDTGPWKSHPRRMLRHKAMIQCARLAFSFAGVYDPDEAERIAEVTSSPRRPARQTSLAEITSVSEPSDAELVDTETGEVIEVTTEEPAAEPGESEMIPHYDEASAIKALEKCRSAKKLRETYSDIEDDYVDSEREIPFEIKAKFDELLESLSEREEKL